MLRRHALASALLAALVAPVAHADEATDIERVTVSASTSRIPDSEAALPNTITVIDQAQLQQQLALTQDISQVLANLIPSFAPSRQKLTNSGETLRGRKPLFLVDGVPQSTPLREGGRDGHTIDPSMIERIEVIHGANALQGLGASGGIINIITKRAPRQDGESFQDLSVAASTALPHESDSTGYRASYLFGTRSGALDLVGGASYASEGLYYDADGDSIAVNDVQGDIMDAESYNLFAKAGWNLDDTRRLQLSANHYDLQGNNHYHAVNGNPATGQLATSARGGSIGEGPRNRSTSLTLDTPTRRLPAVTSRRSCTGSISRRSTAAATGAISGATAAIRTGSTSRRTCRKSSAASSAGRAATCSACACAPRRASISRAIRRRRNSCAPAWTGCRKPRTNRYRPSCSWNGGSPIR